MCSGLSPGTAEFAGGAPPVGPGRRRSADRPVSGDQSQSAEVRRRRPAGRSRAAQVGRPPCVRGSVPAVRSSEEAPRRSVTIGADPQTAQCPGINPGRRCSEEAPRRSVPGGAGRPTAPCPGISPGRRSSEEAPPPRSVCERLLCPSASVASRPIGVSRSEQSCSPSAGP